MPIDLPLKEHRINIDGGHSRCGHFESLATNALC